jgi:two-component system, cell cycle response regulator
VPHSGWMALAPNTRRIRALSSQTNRGSVAPAPPLRRPGRTPGSATAETTLVSRRDGDADVAKTLARAWASDSSASTSVLLSCRAMLIRLDAKAGATFALPNHAATLGRGHEADFRIDDEGVSRVHATIQPAAGGYEIIDDASRNGTVVGRDRVRRGPLKDGDIVQLGPRVCFRFKLFASDEEPKAPWLVASPSADPYSALNRQHLHYRLRVELDVALRSGRDLGLLLLHIDHFARLVTGLGDDAGKTVLRVVGDTLSAELRTSDMLAHYGEGELIVMLRDTNLTVASNIAQRASIVLLDNCPRYRGQLLPTTLSIGVATLATLDEPSLEALIANADQRLFAAKRAGGNRLVAAG